MNAPENTEPQHRTERRSRLLCRGRQQVLFIALGLALVLSLYFSYAHELTWKYITKSMETQTSKLNENKDVHTEDRCIFRGSPIYRKVYVYPSPGENEWTGQVLSDYGASITSWPWQEIDNQTRAKGSNHYHPYSMHGQFATELLVREIFTHPASCLRTHDPEEADLFYVPYLPSVEFHAGVKGRPPSHKTSRFAQALLDVLERKYDGWESSFGLTAKYWKRKQGADHILVFSEPLQGLTHPKNRRGNYHFIHSQKQLSPPIIISVELSTTFVQMYPHCAAKNILLPYPVTDGNLFNGKLRKEAADMIQSKNLTSARTALPTEIDLYQTNDQQARPIAQWYRAGVHGSCAPLRVAMRRDFKCTPSYRIHKELGSTYPRGMHMATFCPCPTGDSASAKRMFDAVLAGCIPLILSDDFVWPFTTEIEPALHLRPLDFSLRWPAASFSDTKYKQDCSIRNSSDLGIQERLELISKEEIRRLRNGLGKAAHTYSYYGHRDDLPSNPLRERILPDGGAAHALVAALAARAGGVRWPACSKELNRTDRPKDPTAFQC